MSLNPPLTDWRGKSAWLIGASSGIGQATAHALHAQGAKVFVSARDGAALDAFVRLTGWPLAAPRKQCWPLARSIW